MVGGVEEMTTEELARKVRVALYDAAEEFCYENYHAYGLEEVASHKEDLLEMIFRHLDEVNKNG